MVKVWNKWKQNASSSDMEQQCNSTSCWGYGHLLITHNRHILVMTCRNAVICMVQNDTFLFQQQLFIKEVYRLSLTYVQVWFCSLLLKSNFICQILKNMYIFCVCEVKMLQNTDATSQMWLWCVSTHASPCNLTTYPVTSICMCNLSYKFSYKAWSPSVKSCRNKGQF